MALEPRPAAGAGLLDVVERILDKGLVINADISVSLAGTELIGIKIRAALASFETAAKYGMDFPTGMARNTKAMQEAKAGRESCPSCGKLALIATLLKGGCPWCGWTSAQARNKFAVLKVG